MCTRGHAEALCLTISGLLGLVIASAQVCHDAHLHLYIDSTLLLDFRSTKYSTNVVCVSKLLTADVFVDGVMDVVDKACPALLFP